MPEVQSDIKVVVTPIAATVDLESLRSQVENIFKKPIKVQFDADSVETAVGEQAERAVRAAQAAISRGQAIFEAWNAQSEKRNTTRLAKYNNAVKQAYDNVQSLIEGGAPSDKDVRGWIAFTSAVEKYRAEISKARAAQTAISKGKSIFAAWDAESEERNVARLEQYNNAVEQAYDNVQSLIKGGAPSDKDARGWIALTSAVEKYRAEISKARAAQSSNRVISKGKSIFAAWDAESEKRNVARLEQYNNAVKQAYDNVQSLIKAGKPSDKDARGWIALTSAVEKYRLEISKARAAQSSNKVISKGKSVFAVWDAESEERNVARLAQYNNAVKQAYDNVQSLIKAGAPSDKDARGWIALTSAVEKYRLEISKARAAQSSNNAKTQNEKNFADIQRQAETYFQKYETNITRNLSLSTKWQNLLNNLRNPDIDNTSVVEYRKQLADLINESRGAGVEIEKTGQKLSRLFGQHLSTAVAMAAIHALRRVLQQTYQNVIELDKALVNLQVSSGKSRSELKSLMMQYSEFAKSLGTTTIAVTQAADTWLRQGYDLSEVETLITDSIHLSVLGKISSEEATKALTSTMKGYGIAVQDASTIVDKFTTVDMNAATSAGDLATAMAECAVSAQLMGVDIDHLTGYLATVMETTQDGAESVGVFMKTMFARMANIKTGKLVDPEDQSDISDVERVLKNQNILLRDAQGNFRNFQEVLEETAQKWRELGEAGKTAEQSALAVAFGGIRNQEKFKVFMENYDTAIKYANIATDSTGNAAKKYEAYMDGIEARMNRLTATFEEFAQTILNSDAIKGVIDFLTNILNLLQQITAWFGNAGLGALTPLFGLGGGILGASGKGRLQQVGLAANMPLYALVATRNELAA